MTNLMYYHKKKNELRLHLNRAPADTAEVVHKRARDIKARVHQFWYQMLNQLAATNEVEDPNLRVG